MNSSNSSGIIENMSDLDSRIAELEKDLAPFLENPEFTIGNIFANSKSELLKIIGISSGLTAKEVIKIYLGKYNEYTTLLQERNRLQLLNIDNMASNIKKAEDSKITVKVFSSKESDAKLEEERIKSEKKVSELEKQIESLKEENKSLYEAGIRVSNAFKDTAGIVEINKQKYSNFKKIKEEEISHLTSNSKKINTIDVIFNINNIEKLSDKVKELENIIKGLENNGKENITLKAQIESLKTRIHNLEVQLISNRSNKLDQFTQIMEYPKLKLELENIKKENTALVKTSNIVDSINIKLVNQNEELIKRLEELEKELKNKDSLLIIKESESQVTKDFLAIIKSLNNGNITIEELNQDEIKLIRNKTSVHPSIAVKAYTDVANNIKHTQADGLKKYTQNQD